MPAKDRAGTRAMTHRRRRPISKEGVACFAYKLGADPMPAPSSRTPGNPRICKSIYVMHVSSTSRVLPTSPTCQGWVPSIIGRRPLIGRPRIENLIPINGRVGSPKGGYSRQDLSYPGAHNGLSQVASALRKAVTLGGRNLRVGYTANAGMSADVHRGRRRTRSPRARACSQ